jgi:predicted CoA-binding protein
MILVKKTLVIGASPKPERYSNKAVRKLRQYGHPVVALAKREGMIDDTHIVTGLPELTDIDTVTLYVGKEHQPEYYNYIMNLHPKRLIFNPGTENAELENIAKDHGIEAIDACTLVLLSIGEY